MDCCFFLKGRGGCIGKKGPRERDRQKGEWGGDKYLY